MTIILGTAINRLFLLCICLNYRQEFPLLLMEILDEPVDTVLKLINKIRMKINDISTDKGECPNLIAVVVVGWDGMGAI